MCNGASLATAAPRLCREADDDEFLLHRLRAVPGDVRFLGNIRPRWLYTARPPARRCYDEKTGC
jgi:hypothetical protein